MTYCFKKNRFKWLAGVIIWLCATGIPVAWGLEPDVRVYGESAYTETDLDVYLYADINTSNLLSFGIKLNYDPTRLAVSSAEKNSQVWYMGDSATKYPYADPDISVPGEITIVGGKIDSADPMSGVSGQRVLLGKVKFARTDAQSVPVLTVGYARGGSYDSFVKAGGTVLDWESVNLGTVIVRERGDANGDGRVTPADMITIRNAYYGNTPLICEPAADCNKDGRVTPADMICVRNKYYM